MLLQLPPSPLDQVISIISNFFFTNTYIFQALLLFSETYVNMSIGVNDVPVTSTAAATLTAGS